MTRPQGARLFAAVFVPPLLLLAGVVVIAITRDLDTGAIFRDPVTVLDGYPLVGAMSAVGVILWWLAAGACLFALAVAQRLAVDRSVRVFLLTAGLITLLLAIDDQFLIHDELAPRYLGLRERDVMSGYVVLVGLWLLLNRLIIRQSEWQLLAAALFFFAASVAFDYAVQITMDDPEKIGAGLDWGIFVEDGLKFMGIVGWSAYLFRYSFGAVVGRADHGHSASKGP